MSILQLDIPLNHIHFIFSRLKEAWEFQDQRGGKKKIEYAFSCLKSIHKCKYLSILKCRYTVFCWTVQHILPRKRYLHSPLGTWKSNSHHLITHFSPLTHGKRNCYFLHLNLNNSFYAKAFSFFFIFFGFLRKARQQTMPLKRITKLTFKFWYPSLLHSIPLPF